MIIDGKERSRSKLRRIRKKKGYSKYKDTLLLNPEGFMKRLGKYVYWVVSQKVDKDDNPCSFTYVRVS